jgi:hypothetical protein
MAENQALRLLAQLLLMDVGQGFFPVRNRRLTMAKIETCTFAIGMALSSLLMFATLAPLA